MIGRILLLVAVVAVLVGLVAYSQHRPVAPVVSGFIEADEIRLGSQLGGRVHRVLVEEGTRVSQGDVLVELEPFDLLEREQEAIATLNARRAEYQRMQAGNRPEEIAQAKANVDRLQALLDELRNGPRPQEIAAAAARLQVARATLKLAEQNHKRVTDLFGRSVATQEQVDSGDEELQNAQAMVIVREQEMGLLEAGSRPESIAQATAQWEEASQAWSLAKRGFRQEEIDGAQAALQGAEAALAALQARKKELQIVSPVDGVVEAMDLQPGDLTGPGAPVMSIVDSSRMWVRAYVPQDRLRIALGQSLEITVDSYPDRIFKGQVSFMARQAEFTPSNVQTPDERSKQVFRIKVMLQEGWDVLRPGMAADVWLEPKQT